MSVPVFSMSEYDFKAALKKTKLAIIPVGSLEQHGNHLPVQLAFLEVRDELLQAMALLADQKRDLARLAIRVQMHAHFHVDLAAKFEQSGD